MIEILSASYGDATIVTVSGGRVDVTKEIKGLISPDKQTLSINVSPANIGVKDLATNKVKSLIVNYRINGEENTVTTQDGSTLALSSPAYVPKTPAGYVYSMMGSVWMNGSTAVVVFLYTLSISLAFHRGGYAMGIAAAVLPLSTFWLFAPVTFILAAFRGNPSQPSDQGATVGGRRRRRR
jgi:hypothetical protein